MSTGEDRLISKENQERGELQMSLMRMVAEQNKEKFIEYDCNTDVLVWSAIVNGTYREIERIEGYYSKNNLSISRIAEEDREVYRKEMERCLKRPMSRVIEVRLLTDDGQKIWHRMYLVSIADDERVVTRLAARVIPVQKEKELQEMMRAQAEKDSLSGIYAHTVYEKKSTEIIEKYKDNLLFVMIDVDNFKHINDNHGHQVGDEVVRQVGVILDTITKGRGVAGRMGGDEFSVCFYQVPNKEEAMNLCIRIKEAIKIAVEGMTITASIGATLSDGRMLKFGEFYYEADEAVYFAKEHGKNQIVFADEIPQRKELENKESITEYSLSEEELELDQRTEYCVISNPFNKKIIYMNQPARNALGISLEEARKLHCYELFKAQNAPCVSCDMYRSHVYVLEGKDQCGLSKYMPDGKFIIESQYTLWKKEPARITNFMNVNNSDHVKDCLQTQMEAQEALSKCWSLILEAGLQEVEYTKVLEVLMEYYDADCCAIITKNDEVYEKVYEHHKNTAQNIAEGLHMSIETGAFLACEVLLDEDGVMRPHYIEKQMKEHPEVAKIVQNGFVHNTIGIALVRQNHMVGILMVLNPRHHLNDYTILKQIGAYFTTDLLRKKLTDVKDYETTHDPLTKMWNREYFQVWLDRYGHYLNKRCGVLMADIFQLGEINKTFGYQIGNQRLAEMADLLRKVFDGYSMFRYDDDQFLVLVHDIEKVQFEKMVHYAKELMAELGCEVSCGYAWLADGDVNDAVREAQKYLDMDRQRLEKENDVEGKTSKRVEQDIIEEVRKGNFRMYLQPKVSAITGQTVGAEGLVRLFNEEKGFVSPGLFIPILEENNAIHLIDMFMLQSAFQFQAAAKEAGRKIVPISINFSKNTLIFKRLMDFIKELCDTYGMPDGMIVIEITETVSTMDHMEVNQIAKALHSMGFAISMDDFGTKYSNMAVLTQFDFDSVKIDRSMILDIVENEKNQTILKHTIGMLEELGLKTVIEGVETAEQVEVLKEIGCDIIQGFYFGRPEPKEKFYELYM